MAESINKGTIEDLKALMEEDFSLLLETFLNDSEQRIIDLSKAQQDNNNINIREVAHALKGSSSNIGAEILAKISYEIELMGQENNLDDIDDAVARLKTEYLNVEEYFQSLL